MASKRLSISKNKLHLDRNNGAEPGCRAFPADLSLLHSNPLDDLFEPLKHSEEDAEANRAHSFTEADKSQVDTAKATDKENA